MRLTIIAIALALASSASAREPRTIILDPTTAGTVLAVTLVPDAAPKAAPAPACIPPCNCGCATTGKCLCKNCNEHTADPAWPAAKSAVPAPKSALAVPVPSKAHAGRHTVQVGVTYSVPVSPDLGGLCSMDGGRTWVKDTGAVGGCTAGACGVPSAVAPAACPTCPGGSCPAPQPARRGLFRGW